MFVMVLGLRRRQTDEQSQSQSQRFHRCAMFRPIKLRYFTVNIFDWSINLFRIFNGILLVNTLISNI